MNKNDSFFPTEIPFSDDGKTITLAKRFIGLTKREWFAGMAMQGMMSVPPRELMDCCSKDETVGVWLARQSIDIADILCAELEKNP